MTRITLEEPRAAGYPVVKRTALGQTFNGAVLKAEARDRLKRGDDGSMQPIVKSNGKHAQELVVTCLTLPGTTAPVGLGDDEKVPAAGDIVRLILKGKAFGDWIEAKRSLPNGTVAVGDVVTQTTSVAQVYDAQGNASGGEITDQAAVDQARGRGRSVGIYGPLSLRAPKDGSEWAEKAVAAYRSLTRTDAEVSAPAAAPGGYAQDDDDDEPPF
ncbi:hypothetical protein ACQI4L_09170 [Mycolicibacterium litorale]|uniref:hypothetical protein n=1 Tax=Mycolicibacterium litorale TaxID=758802 RepID=UPI003CEEB9B6